MSLVVTEGDGEQNEMRMLQDKLGSTMKVVTTLTSQLTELKEQVNTCTHERTRAHTCMHAHTHAHKHAHRRTRTQ